jgi:LacI family repressor for deo operon, udp, cdd, tsx, nupC, and nupG
MILNESDMEWQRRQTVAKRCHMWLPCVVTASENKRSKRATINDVALAAGVATSTVSRALSVPGRVNPSTRERIERVAEELSYVPNSRTRALTSGRTGLVAMLVSATPNPFFLDILRGTQRELTAAGYALLLVDAGESSDVEVSMLEKHRLACDGAILTTSRLSDVQLATLADGMPIVAINRMTRGVPSVVIDSAGGIDQALEHLVSLGHVRVLYVSGPSSAWSNEKRWRAMRSTAARLGVEVSRTGAFASSTAAGAAAADALLNSGATAAVAFNDLLAIGMLERLRERGVRVPEDFSIVGFDDIFGADFCSPPLTTLTSPIEQAGRVAASMLLARFTPTGLNAPARSVLLPTHLTVRESTGPAPEAHDQTASAPARRRAALRAAGGARQ